MFCSFIRKIKKNYNKHTIYTLFTANNYEPPSHLYNRVAPPVAELFIGYPQCLQCFTGIGYNGELSINRCLYNGLCGQNGYKTLDL